MEKMASCPTRGVGVPESRRAEGSLEGVAGGGRLVSEWKAGRLTADVRVGLMRARDRAKSMYTLGWGWGGVGVGLGVGLGLGLGLGVWMVAVDGWIFSGGSAWLAVVGLSVVARHASSSTRSPCVVVASPPPRALALE